MVVCTFLALYFQTCTCLRIGYHCGWSNFTLNGVTAHQLDRQLIKQLNTCKYTLVQNNDNKLHIFFELKDFITDYKISCT